LYPLAKGGFMCIKNHRKRSFFLRAIIRLFCRKVRNKIDLHEFAPGDNFPGIYWRQA